MKNIEKDVKLGKDESGKAKVVDTVEIKQYETAEELAEMDLKLLLSLVNRQLVTDTMNAARADHRETTPGKKKRRELAFNLLPVTVFEDGESWQEKLVACGGDAGKLDALLNSPEVQAAVTAKIGAE